MSEPRRPKPERVGIRELRQKHQAFIVYPLVEASEELGEIRDATRMAEKMRQGVFKDFGVGLVHDDAFVFQTRGEIAVELDHFDVACPFKQSPRKRPFAGTDLDDEVVLRRRERIDNPLQNPPLVQEMLPEPPPCAVRPLKRQRSM